MRRLIEPVFVVGIVFLLTGCNPNLDITFENRTDHDLRVEVSSSGFVEIAAESTKTFTFDIDDENRIDITVLTEEGDVILDEITTKDELEERNYRIIIEEPSSRSNRTRPFHALTVP